MSIKFLLYKVLGRRNTKKIYYRLRTSKKPHFSEAELIADFFFDFLKPVYRCVMIDVGVHHGESCAEYAAAGWQVIGFEPDPNNRDKIPFMKNLQLFPLAVSDQDNQIANLYTSRISSGISSLTAFHASHMPATQVKTVTLRTILRQEKVSRVDFLKIDVEGHDLFVLKGFPFERYTPFIILCEFEDYKTVPNGYTYTTLGDFLVDKGYKVYLSEWKPIIEYGIPHEWDNIRPYPCRLNNAKGWGNFIAVLPHWEQPFEQALNRYLRFLNDYNN
ncbi:MAG: FkbM family methyltransferase [Cytophagales bacterium]|nr:FkbM family methyltransferase [Bernardetiaceae bacterium]MDW8209513.1 FkbM family methyltransferase [Cytophagales bacterium]